MHYYWFKKQRDICQREPGCDMGGFTRLLHSGQADDLMDEASGTPPGALLSPRSSSPVPLLRS